VRPRSTQPVFWVLFGAGGMLSALIGWMLVFMTGIGVPAGLGVPAQLLDYDNVLAFERHWLGKAFTLAVISLFLWHGAHRIFHSLHDFGVPARGAAALACYGPALLGSVVAAVALLAIGF
jgi:fumarate reductase subunit D